MGKDRVEGYLEDAIKAIKDLNILNDGKVKSVYNGYISSFGSGIVQGGLLATAAFFENKNSDAEEDRAKVTRAILQIIDSEAKEKYLFDYLKKQGKISEDLVDQIRDAAVALKLALRTYEFDES